jgi:NDP-sugar pyrophosphorylase family protein
MTASLAESQRLDAKACAQVHCLDTTWHPEHSVLCSLIPFMNRPFLHHVVDRLVERNVQSIDFVCHRETSDYQRCLGNGSRWGATFRFRDTVSHESDKTESRIINAVSVASHALPRLNAEQDSLGMLRVDSPESYLESQLTAMRCGLEGFLTVETEVASSVWVARNVKIHPSATIEGPVLLGENARIGPGVFIGAGSVIGPGCVLGRNSTITKSTIMPNLFIGEGLGISKSIVFGSRIFNTRLATSIVVNDRLLVSPIR